MVIKRRQSTKDCSPLIKSAPTYIHGAMFDIRTIVIPYSIYRVQCTPSLINFIIETYILVTVTIAIEKIIEETDLSNYFYFKLFLMLDPPKRASF